MILKSPNALSVGNFLLYWNFLGLKLCKEVKLDFISEMD